MPRHATPLTANEIDEFSKKLKETVALAEQALALRETLAKFGSVAAVALPAPARAEKPAPTKAPRAVVRGGGKRKRQPGIVPERVAEVLKNAKEGLSLADVAQRLGEANKDRVGAALRKLRAAKKAKVTGDRQFAKWSAA